VQSIAFTRYYKNGLAFKGFAQYSSGPMVQYKTVYKCRACGTTSYKRLMERQPSGAWQPTGPYQCTGCRNVFESLRAWWGDPLPKKDFRPSQMPG